MFLSYHSIHTCPVSLFSPLSTDKVFIGSVKQAGRDDLEITPADRTDILNRYYRLHPAIKVSVICVKKQKTELIFYRGIVEILWNVN